MLKHRSRRKHKLITCEVVCRECPLSDGILDDAHSILVDLEIAVWKIMVSLCDSYGQGRQSDVPSIKAVIDAFWRANAFHQARHHGFTQVCKWSFLFDTDP